jgi:hypothetical protein
VIFQVKTNRPSARLLFSCNERIAFSWSAGDIFGGILFSSFKEDLQSLWRMATSTKARVKISHFFIRVHRIGA